MNLGFITLWPDKSLTNFPIKILHSLMMETNIQKELDTLKHFQDIIRALNTYQPVYGSDYGEPKPHTIRSGNRWRAGMDIDFWINHRTPDMTRFAPRIKVVSTQQINIKYFPWIFTNPEKGRKCRAVRLSIDGQHFGSILIHQTADGIKCDASSDKVRGLILKDGFRDAKQFIEWFDKDLTGQIIHWTDLTY